MTDNKTFNVVPDVAGLGAVAMDTSDKSLALMVDVPYYCYSSLIDVNVPCHLERVAVSYVDG